MCAPPLRKITGASTKMGKEKGPGRPPEIFQNTLPKPVVEPPPEVVLEDPDLVIPAKARARKDEITDPVILELETLPDEELIHLAGNHALTVIVRGGRLQNRGGVVAAVAEAIKRERH
jgi:hypothetical protein